jgi:aryl-alcohol dehydrogenase-like predicted oxidoreductase
MSHAAADEAMALLDAAFELGCNAFDTAAVYGHGAAERRLGEWLEQRRLRQQVIIIDKGCHPARDVARLTPSDLAFDVAASLERLRVDQIDLYLLHRDDPQVPVGEMVSALNDQLALGRIAAFGGSNWTHQRIEQANDYARRHGLVEFAASSPGFSLAEPIQSWPGCVSLHRSRADGALAWYRATGLPVLAWSPLAGGFLSGRFDRAGQPELATPSDRRVIEFYASDANFERLDRLARIARMKGMTIGQAALAYVASVRINLHAVVGCRNRAELQECARAIEFGFSAAELAWLDAPVPQA